MEKSSNIAKVTTSYEMVTVHDKEVYVYCLMTVQYSDRPKFGSVLVPAEIETWTEIPVPAKLVISVSAEISFQKWTEIWFKI